MIPEGKVPVSQEGKLLPSAQTAASLEQIEGDSYDIEGHCGRSRNAAGRLLQGTVRMLAVVGVLTAGTHALEATPAEADDTRANATAITIDTRHPGAPVPKRFFGLSFETHTAHLLARYSAQGNLKSILNLIGPGVVRLSGNAVEETRWQKSGHASGPFWSTSSVTANDFKGINNLLKTTGWEVELGVALKHNTPQAAASEAKAAQSIFGSSLLDVQVGNEPSLYRPRWSQPRYSQTIKSYEQAMHRAAGGFALGGPNISDPKFLTSWTPSIKSIRPDVMTAHYYPMRCKDTDRTMTRLLSPQTRQSEDRIFSRYMRVARSIKRPLRIDEANSASCKGEPGVSDEYGAALWALDEAARAMENGASGINFHNQPEDCRTYSVVCAPTQADLRSGQLRAQPLLYAILMAKSLAVGSERPVQIRQNPSLDNLETHAFIDDQGHTKILAVNFGPSSKTLLIPNTQEPATVQELRGASLTKKTGVTLGGAAVTRSGTWQPNAPSPVTTNEQGKRVVTVPRWSAELIEYT